MKRHFKFGKPAHLVKVRGLFQFAALFLPPPGSQPLVLKLEDRSSRENDVWSRRALSVQAKRRA